MLTPTRANCPWVAMTTPSKIMKMVFTTHIYLEFILSFRLFNGQQGIIIQNFSTRSILTVTNVTQEHFGNYTCVAVNKLGTTNASLPLNRKWHRITKMLLSRSSAWCDMLLTQRKSGPQITWMLETLIIPLELHMCLEKYFWSERRRMLHK